MRMSQQDLHKKSGRVINRSELKIETGFPQISCNLAFCAPTPFSLASSSPPLTGSAKKTADLTGLGHSCLRAIPCWLHEVALRADLADVISNTTVRHVCTKKLIVEIIDCRNHPAFAKAMQASQALLHLRNRQKKELSQRLPRLSRTSFTSTGLASWCASSSISDSVASTGTALLHASPSALCIKSLALLIRVNLCSGALDQASTDILHTLCFHHYVHRERVLS